jgi:hypothetical protein
VGLFVQDPHITNVIKTGLNVAFNTCMDANRLHELNHTLVGQAFLDNLMDGLGHIGYSEFMAFVQEKLKLEEFDDNYFSQLAKVSCFLCLNLSLP